MDNVKNPKNYHENYLIQVTYEMTTPYHDGYCSDPGDDITYNKEIIKVHYPVSDEYDLTTLDGQHISIDELKQFDRNKISLKNEQCDLGSGYCYLYTTFKIELIEIVKVSPDVYSNEMKKYEHRTKYGLSH